MTDREKLEKVYEFVKAQEDFYYKPIKEGEYKFGSMENTQCMFQAISFQKIRYFLEDLME